MLEPKVSILDLCLGYTHRYLLLKALEVNHSQNTAGVRAAEVEVQVVSLLRYLELRAILVRDPLGVLSAVSTLPELVSSCVYSHSIV